MASEAESIVSAQRWKPVFMCCRRLACNYTTTRSVVIRDRRLGLISSFFLLLIAGYTTYQMLVLFKFRKDAHFVGTTRIAVLPPNCAYREVHNITRYCGVGTYEYGGYTYNKHQCRAIDGHDAVFPGLEAHAALLTTRMSELLQETTPDCVPAPRHRACEYTQVSDTTYFVSDVTNYTVQIQHTASFPVAGVSRSSVDMEGELLRTDGSQVDVAAEYPPVREVPPWCASEREWLRLDNVSKAHIGAGASDVVAVKSLIRAGGVHTIDQPNTDAAHRGGDPPETMRFGGMVLLVTIEYSNTHTLDEEDIRYTYRVARVPNTEFKVQQVKPGNATTRTILDRHGIRIVLEQTSKVGFFDFATLLVELVASLGLLAVAKLTVDLVMTTVLPLKALYQQHKAVRTVDFSDLEQRDLDTFKRRDVVNPRLKLPSKGDIGPTHERGHRRRRRGGGGGGGVAAGEGDSGEDGGSSGGGSDSEGSGSGSGSDAGSGGEDNASKGFDRWAMGYALRHRAYMRLRRGVPLLQYVRYHHLLLGACMSRASVPIGLHRFPSQQRALLVGMVVAMAFGMSLSMVCLGNGSDGLHHSKGVLWARSTEQSVLVCILVWLSGTLWRGLLTRLTTGLMGVCGAPWRMVVKELSVIAAMVGWLALFALLPLLAGCVSEFNDVANDTSADWFFLFTESLVLAVVLDVPRLWAQYHAFPYVNAFVGATWETFTFGQEGVREKSYNRHLRRGTWAGTEMPVPSRRGVGIGVGVGGPAAAAAAGAVP